MEPDQDEAAFLARYRAWVEGDCRIADFFPLVALAKASPAFSAAEAFDFERWLVLPERMAGHLREGAEMADVVPERCVVQAATKLTFRKPVDVLDEPVPSQFFEGIRRSPEVAVYRVHNAVVRLALRQQTVLVNGKAVAALSNHGGLNSIVASRDRKPRRLHGSTLVLDTDGAQLFSHFLFDCLPKIGAVEAAGSTAAMFDHILLRGASQKFHVEALGRLGMSLDRIVVPQQGDCMFLVDEAVFVSALRRNFVGADWVYDVACRIFGRPAPSVAGNRRLFLSRSKAARRRIVNEDALLPLLRRRDFEVVWAEDHSVSAFAEIMAGAGTLVSLHGAGLANAVFAGPGLDILEIYGPHITAEYGAISCTRGFRHHVLAGTDAEGLKPWQAAARLHYHAGSARDVMVDPGELETGLDMLR